MKNEFLPDFLPDVFRRLKILPITTLIILAGILVSNTTHATYLSITQSMISAGITDRQTVIGNIKIYSSILTKIENNIHHRKIVVSQINDLSQRLHSQAEFMGYDFSDLILPEINDVLNSARQASQRNDVRQLKQSIASARGQFNLISEGLHE